MSCKEDKVFTITHNGDKPEYHCDICKFKGRPDCRGKLAKCPQIKKGLYDTDEFENNPEYAEIVLKSLCANNEFENDRWKNQYKSQDISILGNSINSFLNI